jgi:hypothetical protein
MKAKILPNIFISVAVSFAFARLLAAGMSDGVLNFSATPLVRRHPTFITFDVPGAISTGPIGINPAGTITGSYADASLIDHSFVRAPNGTITTFDPPGSVFKSPTAINPAGIITGGFSMQVAWGTGSLGSHKTA